jgi:uncharacterized membrane-anchored protein
VHVHAILAAGGARDGASHPACAKEVSIEPSPTTSFPADHPDRRALADEVHARPYEALDTPERATCVAVQVDADDRERERAHLASLCERFGAAPPRAESIHFVVRLGTLRLKWERHSEFSSYTVFAPGKSARPFSEPASSLLPPGWLEAIPGRTLFAGHAKLIRGADGPPDPVFLAEHFDGNVVVGGEIGDGAGVACTDFRIHADGYARFLVLDRSLTPRQAGRMLQRLFEIEAYRMMALLALPVARQQGPRIVAIERSLARLIEHIARADGADEALLGELTALAARVESALVASQYRFGASGAYYELVLARIAELRERRIPGMQTIDEFMTRRLGPAMATCTSMSRRLHDLSERVARASSLLSTRVEIARERQNQVLLGSMDRRARLQLRLQQTVEGLSVAAVTYYVVGLVGYAVKGLKAGGMHVDTDLASGAAIPVVAALVAFAVHRARRRINAGAADRYTAMPAASNSPSNSTLER